MKMSVFEDKSLPLCVDLDGTLIAEDVTHLSIGQFLRSKPGAILLCLKWLARSWTFLKHQVAQYAHIDPQHLTFHPGLLAYIRQEKAKGRLIVLATASDQRLGEQIAQYVGLFDRVVGSDAQVNRCAAVKAQALVALFGERGFVYAGNSPDDLKVWPHGAGIIAVNCPPWVLKKAQEMGKPLWVL